MSPDELDQARSFGHRCHAEALALLRMLAPIPAPSHHEEQRASAICGWMHENGMPTAFIDEANNVICPLHDDGSCDLAVFAAHTDVVFPDTEPLPLREEGGRIYAPGVGDDTANLVAVLLAGRELARRPELLPAGMGVLIVANSCEEGLGNLKGTRRLFEAYGSRIKRFYSFDLYLPQCISTAVGSCRWRLAVDTPGGHSYHDFGSPNAIERLCALVGDLCRIPLPQDVPTTRNVGTITGGTTVNAIAAHAEALFEFRSTSDDVLQSLRAHLEEAVERHRSKDVSITVEERGMRPASLPTRSPELEDLTKRSLDIIRSVTGCEPDTSPASTDANIPLSLGIPANTIGAVRGALLHTRDEYVEAASLEEGLAVAYAIMCAQS